MYRTQWFLVIVANLCTTLSGFLYPVPTYVPHSVPSCICCQPMYHTQWFLVSAANLCTTLSGFLYPLPTYVPNSVVSCIRCQPKYRTQWFLAKHSVLSTSVDKTDSAAWTFILITLQSIALGFISCTLFPFTSYNYQNQGVLWAHLNIICILNSLENLLLLILNSSNVLFPYAYQSTDTPVWCDSV